ncbi:hypothetical protein NBRC10512_007665 [Rhodotorula toruloides]|uniref:RHTO0S05e00694g1_1 n=2 Tax=Rhodotorula toruloides TaxID=5286 RepID=A0A061ASY7_RHOTO|nr:hormone-sensitive lipase [Rhodotorula toruloides NP11]EMS20745.1 hormone-sensitive lipase [Rhodotorula toruloides NP11]CDR40286.1 RHTO0S05e00694g1_1 [Rhodotorula toruloides]
MLDQLAGKPSPSWRRSQVRWPPHLISGTTSPDRALTPSWGSQVGLVLLFWISRILLSPAKGPRVLYLRRLNRLLARFTPWQIILSTLTILYAVRHGDVLLGLQAPEPLARLYSRDYYRATWFVTALDAGFATAMNIRWKWLRDIASLLFSAYYLLLANEADEKLRKFRAFCTVEMLRVTWEKTSNPYIRFFTRKDRPPVTVRRKLFLPRPQGSRYTKPLTVYLYYHGPSLSTAHELVMDIPGGGFICMNPEHHEERLLRWARKTGKVVVSFDYGKAPEYPFPYAIDEMYDAYSLLHATKGRCIGMNTSGEKELRVVLTGDSAGANIATGVVLRILENRQFASSSSRPSSSSTTPIPPLPVALVFAYAALSFHFTSWMSSSDLRVLRSDSHPDIASLLRQKDHLDHRSPLAVVEDVEKRSSGSERGRPKVLRRRRTTSWGRGLVRGLPGSASFAAIREGYFTSSKKAASSDQVDQAARDEEEEVPVTDETEKSLSERVVWWDDQAFGGGEQVQRALGEKVREEEKGVGVREKGKQVAAVDGGEEGVLSETRLAMTSRTAFFNDRIISPSMCRAMALLYIGPRNAPDLHSDYHISPIFTPPALLAHFPPVYLSCGERDPFVDDTVLFAGKLREAKESRKLELLSRESRFGAGLRMSSSTTARDPILDQDEDDWVQTSIIAGWSHGYLQMVSLLPAAEKVIDMHADWIVEAFERAGEAEVTPTPGAAQPSLRRLLSPIAASPLDAATPKGRAGTPAQPINIVPPTPVVPQVELDEAVGSPTPPSVTATPDPEGLRTPAQTSEGEEDVLTFTPRRRRGSSNASRTGSPSPAVVPNKVSPPSPTSPTFTRRTSSQSGSHDAHLVTPVERALREDLHASPLVKHNPPASLSAPTTGATPRSATPGTARLASAGRPSSFFTAPIQSPAPVRSASRTLSPPPAPSPAAIKGARSNSSGSLPAPQGTVFIDAKELLRRRKEDVVFGISSSNGGTPKNVSRDGSRKGSDNEGEGEGKGDKIERRKTVD